MNQAAHLYGQALYTLARDEGLDTPILGELTALEAAFSQEPDYLRLLSAPNLPKPERCRILDEGFRGRVEPYVLNFLKILTEKGLIRRFSDCCGAYRAAYNREHNILPVTAVTAVPLSEAQQARLERKLAEITGKTIQLSNRVDPACLGGVRLNYDGTQVDDTVAHRLESVRSLLRGTTL